MTVKETFFLVLREDKYRVWSLPAQPYRHDAFDKAKAEAERLATAHPGVTFYVFASQGEATAPVPTMWTKHDEIPF